MKNQKPKNKNWKAFLFLSFFFVPVLVSASTTSGTIDPTHNLAWGENLAWINFSANNDVTVTDSALTGNIWSQTYGWISLNPSAQYNVINDGNGNLSGYAWGQSVGWINFSGAIINTSGKFTGVIGDPATTAGRISFNCAQCDVETDWRSVSARVTNSAGGPLGTYVSPAITPVPNPVVTPTTSPPVANPTTPPPITNTSIITICPVGNLFSTTTGLHCTSYENITANQLTVPIKTNYNFGTTTLKFWSKGEAVKELQRFLNKNLNLNLKVDGVLGLKTIAIIKQWQKAHGLVADGLVGAKTKLKMNAEVK